MTEADTESIWATTWDTARFGKCGIRIAEILNFLIYDNCTTQCTEDSVLPILEQISEEILLELANAAKANKFSDIWGFIQANISKISWKYYDNYLLKKVRKALNREKTIEIVERNL